MVPKWNVSFPGCWKFVGKIKRKMVAFVSLSRYWSRFSWPYFNRETLFFFKYSILILVPFYLLLNSSIVKIMKETSVWAFRVFFHPWFHFCFQFFRSVALNKVPKRCLNTLTPTSTSCGFGQCWITWTYSVDFCAIISVKRSRDFVNRNRRIEIFFVFFSGWFSWDSCIFSNFLTQLQKTFVFVLSFNLSVPCYTLPQSFRIFSLKLEEKKEPWN